MVFHINFRSGKPVYLQVVDQVKSAAASGALRTGDALPSIRPLAEELRVNRNTVAKAYAQLEADGVIETQPGRGCFVRATRSPLKKDARREILIGGIDEVVVQAHHLQIAGPELISMVRERFDTLAARRSDALAARQAEKDGHKQGAS